MSNISPRLDDNPVAISDSRRAHREPGQAARLPEAPAQSATVRSRIEAAIRRALDVGAALALLAAAVPAAFILLAPYRRAVRPRWAVATRIGRDGRAFALRREALEEPRSRLGRSLAGSWLPRWPALLSIVAGDLSFVGPQALTPAQAAALVGGDRDRLAVTPGLLCTWWLEQRANIDFDSEAESVRRYLRERSLLTDLSILLRSLVALPYGGSVAATEPVVRIAGIRLINLRLDEFVAAIDAALAGRVRTQVAFVNPACVNIAAADPDYRAALADADWVCPDGIGMKIAGRLLGRPIRQNLNGTDLFPRLCALAAERGYRIYLLGALPGVADTVARFVERTAPGAVIAGVRSGFFGAHEEEAVIASIRAARPDLLLVAMGVPRQDLWLRRNLARCGATVGIGVGGLFDFYGGRIPRAPRWLREIGGEWIYRLMQEPRRMWRRYLIGNAAFLARVVRERRDERTGRRRQARHSSATIAAPSRDTLR